MAKIKDWLTKERVSNRIKNRLREEGYTSKDMVWHTFHNHPKELMRIPQFGDVSMANLEKWLRGYTPTTLYTPDTTLKSPKQQSIFEQMDEFVREPDSFDLIAEWMEKAATAIDLNTKTLQEMNKRVAHIEDMLEKSKKLNEFQALIKRWET
jgi:hypothetical protein